MNEELDLDSMLEEFEQEWDESNEEETQEEEVEESQEETETEPEPTEEQETPNPNDEDAEKRNRAFADLRRQADENRKYADFIQRLAQESGVSPEDLLARYEERRLAEEAERKQVPVEFFKESRDTANRLSQLEERMRAERLDTQIQAVSSKYGANDDNIRDAFKYMIDSGVDPRTADNVDFEKFYRAAHLDTIIQKEVESARQKDLEDKKKRQEAAIGNGTSVSQSSPAEWSDEDVDAELERMGIRI